MSHWRKKFSIKEKREQKLISDGHKGDHWEASYPWIKNPEKLPDNRNAALSVLMRTERLLLKNTGNAEIYQAQIKDMVE